MMVNNYMNIRNCFSYKAVPTYNIKYSIKIVHVCRAIARKSTIRILNTIYVVNISITCDGLGYLTSECVGSL